MIGTAAPLVSPLESARARAAALRSATRRARRVGLVFCAAALFAAGAPPRATADVDPTVPTVQLISPLAGSTLADPVTVSATASDDVGVVGVQFLLDGTPLGAEVLAPPYALHWDVTTVENGNHTLSAVARDADDKRATVSALVTVWKVTQQATVFATKPLPIIRDRLGRMPRDFVWGGAASKTVVNTGYLAYDRDPLDIHDLSWFLEHHPDWLVYDCDKNPVRYFGRPLLVFDITNPAVRDYQYRVFVRNHIKREFDGIAIDNFTFTNYAGKCGVYENGVWRQKYTGAPDDPQYTSDAIAWLTWMSDRVHAAQGLVAINVIEPFHPVFDVVASKVDLIYFEAGGFINTYCAAAWTDESWLKKFRVLRKVALERGLAVQDETCDYMSQLTPELVSWDVANFFLVREDRSYFSMTQSYARRPLTEPDYDGPELRAPLGKPLAEPQQHGTLWARPYENGIVVVNPSSTTSGTIALGAQVFEDLRGRVFYGDVTVPPASGWVFLRAPLAASALSVTRGGSGTGAVTSDLPGIVCGADCSAFYPAGTVVTLSAAADAGSVFTGWSGGDCGGTGPCTVTVGSNVDVSASFTDLPPNLLTAGTNGHRFSAGHTIVLSIGLNNPGLPVAVDLYVGLILPDGDTVVFFTAASDITFGRLSDVGTFRPAAVGFSLAAPLTVTVPDFLGHTWTGTEPRGTYVFFLVAMPAGAMGDGSLDPGDLLAVSAAQSEFHP